MSEEIKTLGEYKNLIDALKKRGIKGDELLLCLQSETVFWILRHGVKSPSSSGMDDYEDSGYYDLYNIVTQIQKD